MELCIYCGQEANYQFKNGTWCCGSNVMRCTFISSKCGESGKENHKGQVAWNKNLTKETNTIIRKISEKVKGENNSMFGKHSWNYNLTKETDKRVEKFSKSSKGKKKSQRPKSWTEKRIYYMLNGGAKHVNSFPYKGYNNIKEWMENAGAAYINSFVQNPSKEEVNLRPIISKVAPYVIYNYPIYRGKGKRNYNVDMAIPYLDIIIEYDGWYHFDTEEHKQYHNKRQQEIEEEGWKFLRYNIFQKFPTLEQVKEDIQKLISGDI